MPRVTVDLRVKGKGCTGDPVYRLNAELGKGYDELELLTNPIKLPLAVVSLIAKRKGYVIVEHSTSEDSLRVVLKKVQR